jgi:hypothetical protein
MGLRCSSAETQVVTGATLLQLGETVKINTFTVMLDILSKLFQNVAVDIHKIVMIHSNLPMAAPCGHLY